jgi:hypothetical protein
MFESAPNKINQLKSRRANIPTRETIASYQETRVRIVFTRFFVIVLKLISSG